MDEAHSSRQILFVLSALLDRDVLADQTGNLVSLIRLDARHSLLHQITALHVQIQNTIFRFDFSRRYDFGVGIVQQRLLQHVHKMVFIPI